MAATSTSVWTTMSPCDGHTEVSTQLSTFSNLLDEPTGHTTTITRSRTARRSTRRPSTARPRTGVSTLGAESQEIICAVSEARGISPTVGLAFVNLDTAEAVLCEISDTQTYIKTVHKIAVFAPSMILIVSSSADPKSKLFSVVEETAEEGMIDITLLDRRYWAEKQGLEYIQQLAFADDVESIKAATGGKYYAVCCFAAILKYIELATFKTFPYNSLRIKYEPSEGSMMIDLSTIHTLELVKNLQNPRSKDCLFGLLNQTSTPMGARLLRSNILQPLTCPETLNMRYEAVEEVSTKEHMFFGLRTALKSFGDVDKTLTKLILVPTRPTLKDIEQAVNNVMMLKQTVHLVRPVFEALTGARCVLLQQVRSLCAPEHVELVLDLINETINADTTIAKKPLDLRNHRTYAVRSGVNGLLDVARQTYKEAIEDALQGITALGDEHDLHLETKFDNARQFYIRLPASDLESKDLPPVFINVFRKKDNVECQTLELLKSNQRIADAHHEVLMMSDKSIQELIANLREHLPMLFKICEGLAMADMVSSFAQMVTVQDYVRPEIADTLAIRAGRHPIREKIHKIKFVPNHVYATQQTRFQIVTGCNMSGKSTYIRTVALMTIMAQIGSFVPAQYGTFPIIHQLFARVSVDDSIETNMSTFTAEMRETAFILQNIDRHSMAIIDELGRGTSTRDGLAIAIAIAEALIESRALVWFATHFRDLATIMSERNGVSNLHLAVDMSYENRMEMLYRIETGTVQEAHYGLKLAKVLPLPPDVLTHAEHVAHALERRTKRKAKNSLAMIHARRNRLLLDLKEHLLQARDGHLNDADLMVYLKELQRKFVHDMSKLDDEAREAELGIENDARDQVLEAENAPQAFNQDGEQDSRLDHEQDQEEPHEVPGEQSSGDLFVSESPGDRPISISSQSGSEASVEGENGRPRSQNSGFTL